MAGCFRRSQASTSFESTVMPVSLKVFRTVSSKLLFEILPGIADISRHSRQEYWSFSAYFLSRIRFYFNKLLFTLLVTKSWDLIFVNLSLKEVSYVFISANILLNRDMRLFEMLVFIIRIIWILKVCLTILPHREVKG